MTALFRSLPLLALTVVSLAAGMVHAADAEFTLTIKDHKFEPAELRLPAGQKIKLTVHNMDKTVAEFESKPLKREKVIQGGASAVILLGPLKPGSYPFVEEFHEDVTKGVIIVE